LPYLIDRFRKSARAHKPKRAWVAITDHYEPLGMGDPLKPRLAASRSGVRSAAHCRRRSTGCRRSAPQYSFSTRRKSTRRDLLDGIAEMVRLGVGMWRCILHHDNEQRDSFIRKVSEYCRA